MKEYTFIQLFAAEEHVEWNIKETIEDMSQTNLSIHEIWCIHCGNTVMSISLPQMSQQRSMSTVAFKARLAQHLQVVHPDLFFECLVLGQLRPRLGGTV